jgi:hypothetical protein
MQVRAFSTSLLLGLLISPYGGPVTLQHRTASLAPEGPKLRISLQTFDAHPLTVQNGLVVVQAADAVRVVDAQSLRVVRRYPLRRKGVCAVGVDGTTAVALVGCGSAKSSRFAIVRFGGGNAWIPLRRRLDPLVYPVSFAFGDGKLFVARPGMVVDVLDLRTGAVSSHRPARTLAKGEGYVRASWLGGHLLALNGTVVDIRSWRRRTLAEHAVETVAGGRWLATYGPAGVAVYTRDDLTLYRRVLRGQVVDEARIVGRVLYVRVGLVWHVIDVVSGRSLARLLPDDSQDLWLL